MIEKLEKAKVKSIAEDMNKYLSTLCFQPFLSATSLVILLGSNIDVIQDLLSKADVSKDNELRKDLDALRRKLWVIKDELFHVHVALKKKENNK